MDFIPSVKNAATKKEKEENKMPIKEKHFCPKCGRTLAEDKFYKSRNLEKYPTGRLTECKDCLTRHVDN